MQTNPCKFESFPTLQARQYLQFGRFSFKKMKLINQKKERVDKNQYWIFNCPIVFKHVSYSFWFLNTELMFWQERQIAFVIMYIWLNSLYSVFFTLIVSSINGFVFRRWLYLRNA